MLWTTCYVLFELEADVPYNVSGPLVNACISSSAPGSVTGTSLEATDSTGMSDMR